MAGDDIVQSIALSGQDQVLEAFGEIASAGTEAFARVAEAAEKAESPFAKLAETLAGVAAAGTAIGGLTFKWADESAKTVHQMEILADQTGESVENISALEGAITALGGSGEGLSASFRRMGQAITQEWQKVKEEVANASDKVIDDNLRVDRAEESVDRARMARQKAFGGRVDPHQEQLLKRREAVTALEHAEQAEHEAEKKRTTDRINSYEVVSKAVGDVLKGQKTLAEAGKEANLTTDNIFKGLIGNTEGAEEALKNFNGSLLSIRGEGPKVLEVFKNVADFVKNSGNAAENSAVMMRLMGRAMGSDMIPVFKQGRQGIEEFMHKMEELGLTMGDVEEHRATAFHQAFNRLSSVLDTTKTKLGLMFAPAWAENMDKFTEYVSQNHKQILAWGGDIAGKITPYIKGFGESMLGLSRAIIGDDTRADEGVEKWQKTFETIGKSLRSLKDDASSFVKPFKDTFNKLFDQDASTLQIGAGMLIGFRTLGGKLGQAALAGFAAEWTWEKLKEQFSGKKGAPAGAPAPTVGKQSLLEELSPIGTARAEEAPKAPAGGDAGAHGVIPPQPHPPEEKQEDKKSLPTVTYGTSGPGPFTGLPVGAAARAKERLLGSSARFGHTEEDVARARARALGYEYHGTGAESAGAGGGFVMRSVPVKPPATEATPPDHPDHPAGAEAAPDSGGGFPGGLAGAAAAGYVGLQALLHPFKTLKFGYKAVRALLAPRQFLSGLRGGLGLGEGAAAAGGAAEAGGAAGALPEIGVAIPGAAAAGGLTAAGALSGASAFGIFSTIVGAAKGYADRQRGQYPEAASKEDEITSTLGRNSRGIVRLLRKRAPDAENEEIRKALEENEKNLSTSTTGTMDKFQLPSREDRGKKRSEVEDDATKSLKDMADATDKVNEAQKPQAGAISSVTEALKSFVTPANAAEAGLQKTGTSADTASSGLKDAGEAATQAAGGLGDVPGPTKNVASAMDELAEAIKRLISILQGIGIAPAQAKAPEKAEEGVEGGARKPPGGPPGGAVTRTLGGPVPPGMTIRTAPPSGGVAPFPPAHTAPPAGAPPAAFPPAHTAPPAGAPPAAFPPAHTAPPPPAPPPSTPPPPAPPPSGAPTPPPIDQPPVTPPGPPPTGPGGAQPGGGESGVPVPFIGGKARDQLWPSGPPSSHEIEEWQRQGSPGGVTTQSSEGQSRFPDKDWLDNYRRGQGKPGPVPVPVPGTEPSPAERGSRPSAPPSSAPQPQRPPPVAGGPQPQPPSATQPQPQPQRQPQAGSGPQPPSTPPPSEPGPKPKSEPGPKPKSEPGPKPEAPKAGESGPGEPGQGVPGGGVKPELPWWMRQLESPHGEPPSAKPPQVPMPRPRPPEATPLDIDTTKKPPPAFTTPPPKERAPTDDQTKPPTTGGIGDAEKKRLQEQQDIANEVWGRVPRKPYGGPSLEKKDEPYPAPEGKTWVGIYGAGGKLLRRDLVIDTSRVRKGEGFFPFPHGGGQFLPKDTKVTRQPDGSMKYQTPDGKEFTIDKKGVQTGDPYLPAEDLPIYKKEDDEQRKKEEEDRKEQIPQFAVGGAVGDEDELKRQREQEERRRQQDLQAKQDSGAPNVIHVGGLPGYAEGGPVGADDDETRRKRKQSQQQRRPEEQLYDPAARAKAQYLGEGDTAKAQYLGNGRGGCMPGTGQPSWEQNVNTGEWHLVDRPCLPAGGLAAMARIGGKAEGGPVGGHGSGTSDSNLAWLSKGEYVVRADGSNLHEAIDHFTRSFATGGIVGAFTDSIRGYSDGGRVSAASAGGKDNTSYHQLDLRTDKGNFRVSAAQDTMEALRSSALAGKLSRTGERPSWFS